MIALGHDMKSKVSSAGVLHYASTIFASLKVYLKQKGQEIYSKKNKIGNLNLVKDKTLVEMGLQEKFEDDKDNWPRAKWSTFLNLLFEDIQYVFKSDTHEMLERL